MILYITIGAILYIASMFLSAYLVGKICVNNNLDIIDILLIIGGPLSIVSFIIIFPLRYILSYISIPFKKSIEYGISSNTRHNLKK